MHHYPHHIGDFNSATRHLTRVERSLYRDLIELYYDTEQPLPADDFDRLARRVIASTDEEKAALHFVLDEFFELDGGVYRHERCEQEIEKYRNNNSAKAKAGKASAEARKKKAEAAKAKKTASNEQNSTGVEQPSNECATNQEPRTKNQEPINKKNKQKKSTPLITFNGWLDRLRESGEKPIPEGSAVFKYAADAGIPSDYLRMFWVEFKARYSLVDKKYKDWRAVFNRAVRGNWFELWWHDGEGYQLTSKGRQAMTALTNQETT